MILTLQGEGEVSNVTHLVAVNVRDRGGARDDETALKLELRVAGSNFNLDRFKGKVCAVQLVLEAKEA